jgi:hypothetical protein
MYYNWKINYRGNITWTGDTVTNIQGEDEAAPGETTWNDVVLIGDSSVEGTRWTQAGAGSWSDAGNWNGTVPGGVGKIANFLGDPGGAVSVNVDSPVTVGYLNFDNASGYTISGSQINLQAPGGDARIIVSSGNHTISAPIAPVSNLDLKVIPAGSTLTLTGNIDADSRTIKKTGAGTAVVETLQPVQAIDVRQGKLKISQKGTANSTAGITIVKTLSIASGSQLDLTNNGMIVDYDLPLASNGAETSTAIKDASRINALTAIRSHLVAGRLMTSASTPAGTKLGYGATQTLGWSSFAGLFVDSSAVVVKFTYAGDANLDGQVTISDLGDLASNWQSTGVFWGNGDFNYDGAVTISDLGDLASNWQAGVGNPLGMTFEQALAAVGLGGVAVPEPATMALALGLLGVLSSRRRA